jgi:hypothetical protein
MAQQPQQNMQNMQQMYVPQMNNQRQVPVRLSSVNFEGVFTSSRLNMENLITQNLYNNNNNNNIQPTINQLGQPPRPNNVNLNPQMPAKSTPQQPSQKK